MQIVCLHQRVVQLHTDPLFFCSTKYKIEKKIFFEYIKKNHNYHTQTTLQKKEL